PRLANWAARPAVNRVLHAFGWLLLASFFLTAPDHQRWWGDVGPAWLAARSPLAWNQPGVFGLLAGALIWIAVVCEGRLLPRLLASPPLRFVGLVSFSVYLLHVPVKNQLVRLGLAPGELLFASTTLATLLLAAVTYTLVERPFLHRRGT
ncbi:MAG: hypothetical protein MJE66_23015, partial [Proteobacteria bacterium]|nr:hypothetical protein [Pseudomonadota bacterium]